jgi:aryl-alcohol dehydrogenase-like predicted oxidoreductase
MQKRRLGSTPLEITRICLGTWAIGGGDWQFGWGPQDERDSVQAIRRAVELGINWLDTAPAYGLGHCEEVVGRALREISQKPLVFTKCARCWDEKRSLYGCLKRESVVKEIEASLRRLQIEVIDLYQIHWPQPEEDIEEGWEAIAQAIKQGKIRYGGVSNFNVAQMKRLLPIHPISSLQPPFSMVRRDIEAEILPFCGANGIGTIVYSPMQKGLLTDKLTKAWADALAPNDHRRNDPNFQEPKLSKHIALVEGLKKIAQREGHTVGQLAIAWALHQPHVTAAIVGARAPKQIEETAPAADWNLSDGILKEIDSLLALN